MRRTLAVFVAACVALTGVSAAPMASPASADVTTEGHFIPLWNTPLLETANGNGTPNGQVQKIPANGTMTFQALGRGGIASSGVSAASLILNAVSPAASGYLSVYPSDKPTTISTLAFTAGESTTGADYTQITSTGKITVANRSSSPLDVLISTNGYFRNDGGKFYMPLTTKVLWDSRAQYATGTPARTTPLDPWNSIEIDVAGRAGMPADAAAVGAVAVNIGTTDATANGEIKLDPIDSSQGVAALRYTQNDWNNSAFSVVATSGKGKLRLTNASSGKVNVTISVRGYFTLYDTVDKGTLYHPAVNSPVLLDTATGTGTQGGSTAKLGPEQTIVFNATGPSPAPLATIAAAALQINVKSPTHAGWLTARAADQSDPWIGTLVYQANENATSFDNTIPDGVGGIAITNHGEGSIHLNVAARGYFIYKNMPGEVIERITNTEDLARNTTSNTENIVMAAGMAPRELAVDETSEEDLDGVGDEQPLLIDPAKMVPNGATIEVSRNPAEGLTVSGDGASTSVGLPATGSAAKTNAGTVVYGGTEQQNYTAAVQPTLDGGARVLVHMNDATAPTTYRFPVTMPNGARMEIDPEDGSVDIVKDTSTDEGVVPIGITRISAPWVRDAAGQEWPANYSVNGNELVLTVDLTPRTDNGTTINPVFPVVADPEVNARSAFGCKSMMGFGFDFQGLSLKIPAGLFFCYKVSGKGKKVTHQYGSIDRYVGGFTHSKFYHWKIDFLYYDVKSKKYGSDLGALHYNGTMWPSRKYGPDKYLKYGKACATFSVMYKERARHCHYIEP